MTNCRPTDRFRERTRQCMALAHKILSDDTSTLSTPREVIFARKASQRPGRAWFANQRLTTQPCRGSTISSSSQVYQVLGQSLRFQDNVTHARFQH